MRYSIAVVICFSLISCTSKFVLHPDMEEKEFQKIVHDLELKSGNMYLKNDTKLGIKIANIKRDSLHYLVNDTIGQQIPVSEIYYFRYINHWRGAFDMFVVGSVIGVTASIVSVFSGNQPDNIGEFLPVFYGVLIGVVGAPLGLIAGHSYEYFFKFPYNRIE